jgi:UDP-N-acetyl-D-glucosamine dehydrogenase
MSSTKIEPQILAAMDAVIIVTDHSVYDFAEIVKHASLVIDTRNATREIDTGREKIVMA